MGRIRNSEGKFIFQENISSSYRKIYHEGRTVLLHRFIAEKLIGRKLTKKEVVHHKDGNKKNNNPENLSVVTMKKHGYLHSKLSYHGRCIYCKVHYTKHKNHRTTKFCSRSCAMRYRWENNDIICHKGNSNKLESTSGVWTKCV